MKIVPDFPATGAKKSINGEVASYISAGRDSMLHAWSQSGDIVSSVSAHRGSINCLSAVRNDISFPFTSLSSSTPMILSGGSDSYVRLWDLKRMKLLSEINCGGVTSKVCWIGSSFVTAGTNGILKLWKSNTNSMQTNQNDVVNRDNKVDDVINKDWICNELTSHQTGCTDLMCNNFFIASASKNGQILRWSRG